MLCVFFSVFVYVYLFLELKKKDWYRHRSICNWKHVYWCCLILIYKDTLISSSKYNSYPSPLFHCFQHKIQFHIAAPFAIYSHLFETCIHSTGLILYVQFCLDTKIVSCSSVFLWGLSGEDLIRLYGRLLMDQEQRGSCCCCDLLNNWNSVVNAR